MAPRRPKILNAQAYGSKLWVSGEPFLDQDTSPHADTAVRAWTVDGGSLVVDTTAGEADTNVLVEGLSLTPGDAYRVRIRYQDAATDWSNWSANFITTVPIDLGYTSIDTGGEPASGGTLPVTPSFPLDRTRTRPILEWTFETGHIMRRPRQAGERLRIQLVWEALTTAERDTLEAFVKARAAAGESFVTGVDELDSRTFYNSTGALEIEQIAPGVHRASLVADEVFPP